MTTRTPEDYVEAQGRQWRLTLALTALLFTLYVFFIGAAAVLVSVVVWGFRGGHPILTPGALARTVGGAAGLALILAAAQYLDARKNGARFILRQLGGEPSDPHDRYHREFADTVDEIRIAAGLPRVNSYVLPTLALNSLALIEADGTPAVAATEGLLSESTRDELQAVAAHELAHIVRGDAFFVTLACSLADTFERVSDWVSPGKDDGDESATGRRTASGGSSLIGGAAAVSAAAIRFLSTLISREREYLADAAAVELCRSPEALARVLVKARLKNAFVGDFSLTYSPLLMVSSDPLSENEGLRGRLFSTHPPVMSRVERLAAMAHKTGAEITEEVWALQQNRKERRRVLVSQEEFQQAGPPSRDAGPSPAAGQAWLVQDDKGNWIGPLGLTELLRNPYFLPSKKVRNIPEGVEALGSDFPAIREAMQRDKPKASVEGGGSGLCPRCGVPLGDFVYEGVPVRVCRRCLGKLVDSRAVDRILARREFTFSAELVGKAERFQSQFLSNPIKAEKEKDKTAPAVSCPSCGYRMAARPYNYQYFLPVEKCLSCDKIWFDADELEILQILVEKVQARTREPDA